uniref:Edg1 TPR repeats region domain-containing protein n=1 Tax=Plectus sambesii TaxID=2011161 RepID=A0A914X6W6_9BILA
MGDSSRKWPLPLYTFVNLVESRSPEFSLSALEALKYSAGQGDLSSLISKALSSGQDDETAILFRKLVDIVWKRINHYSRSLAALHGCDIQTGASTQDDSPLSMRSADGAHVRRELEFFVDVFAMINNSTVRGFTRLFTTEQYDKMDQIVDALRTSLGAIGLNRFIEIPTSLKPLLVTEEEIPLSSSATVAPLAADEKNSSEQLPEGLEESIAGVLADFKDLNFNLGALQSLQTYAPKLAKVEYVDAMTDGMEAMFKMVDIRVREVFFATFQKLFVYLPKERRNEAMQRYYAKRGVENLKKFIQSYDADLTHWSNRIGDHNQFQGADGRNQLDEMCANFGWLFLVAPKPTLWSLLTLCMASEAVVPNVIKVLRNLPAVLTLADPQTEDGAALPVPLSGLRRLLNKNVDGADSADKFLYVASAFARDKRIAKKTLTVLGESTEFVTTEQPVIEPSALINDLIRPEILAERHSLLMLQLLGRLLTGKSAPIKWIPNLRQASVWSGQEDLSSNGSVDPGDSAVEAPKLLLLLLDVYRKSAKVRGGGELSRTAVKSLKALGDRLGLDAIVFSQLTAEWIVGQLNEHEWTVRLLVTEWLAKSIGEGAGQKLIPTCLWKALPSEVRSDYSEIDCSNHSPVECFMRSFFELATIGPDYAIALIEKGFATIPSRELLRPALAQTLVDCASNLPTEQLLNQIYPVLKSLVGKLDPSREHSFLDSTSNATWRGLTAISALLLLGDATLLALKSQAVASGPTMLQSYCQIAKEHIDGEMNDLRRSRQATNRLPGNDDAGGDRTVAVAVQLNQIFFQSCQLAKTGDKRAKIAQCLQLLLICLTEYNEELNRLISVPLEIVADTREESLATSAPKERSATASVHSQTTTPAEVVGIGHLEQKKEGVDQQLTYDAAASSTPSSGEMSPALTGHNENRRPTPLDDKADVHSQHANRSQYKPRGLSNVGRNNSDQRSTSVENALFQANAAPQLTQSSQPAAGYPQQWQSSPTNFGRRPPRDGASSGQQNSFQHPPPSRPWQSANDGVLGFAGGNRGDRGRIGNRGGRQQQTWSAAIDLMEPNTRNLLETKTAQFQQQQPYYQPTTPRNASTIPSWNGSQNTPHAGGATASSGNRNNSSGQQQSTWSGSAKATRGGGNQRFNGGGSGGGGGGWNKRGGGAPRGAKKN